MTDEQRPDPWLGKAAEQGPSGSAATPSAGKGGDDRWARDALERIAMAGLQEQRRARRWGIFFKALLFVSLSDWEDDGIGRGRHTAVVEINGVIADDRDANADNIIASLRDAFEDKNTAGVILRINSPGGSPVQAGYVNDEIRRLRAKYPDIKLYAVITDICASGGYYIAAAADEIYADKASMVGSIGVLMDGFGFVDALKKLGIERRLITAGAHKGFLDPFSPLKDSDRQHLESMLDNIHQQFINTVRQGRGERLKENDQLFSGLVWTGEQSMEIGLVDGLGSADYVAREIIGVEKMVNFTHRPPLFERFAERIGATMANTLAESLEGKIQ
jgi:protease-4